MDPLQLKRTEYDISAMQAKLGLLRSELKRCQNEVEYNDINTELRKLEHDIDEMQKKYIKGKEALNAL